MVCISDYLLISCSRDISLSNQLNKNGMTFLLSSHWQFLSGLAQANSCILEMPYNLGKTGEQARHIIKFY